MAEFKYQFKAIDDQEKISGSKICNIIKDFPDDYSEQAVLIYGKLKTLFGDPGGKKHGYYITAHEC